MAAALKRLVLVMTWLVIMPPYDHPVTISRSGSAPASLDGVIDSRHDIFVVGLAPRLPDRPAKLLTVAG